MKLGVIGTGNVGAALLHELVRIPAVDNVFVLSRDQNKTIAALRDVASCEPDAAGKLVVAKLLDLEQAQLIVMACGNRRTGQRTADENLSENARITREILEAVRFNPTTVLITVASPVDDITVLAARVTGLPSQQVLGFGGDLDRNRLEFLLRQRGSIATECHVVGEHGARAIPIFQSGSLYSEVASDLRAFVHPILAANRNSAPSRMLGRLCDTIVSDNRRVHHVCGFHPQYGVHLTWPFFVGRSGLLEPMPVSILGSALKEFESLLASRHAKSDSVI